MAASNEYSILTLDDSTPSDSSVASSSTYDLSSTLSLDTLGENTFEPQLVTGKPVQLRNKEMLVRAIETKEAAKQTSSETLEDAGATVFPSKIDSNVLTKSKMGSKNASHHHSKLDQVKTPGMTMDNIKMCKPEAEETKFKVRINIRQPDEPPLSDHYGDLSQVEMVLNEKKMKPYRKLVQNFYDYTKAERLELKQRGLIPDRKSPEPPQSTLTTIYDQSGDKMCYKFPTVNKIVHETGPLSAHSRILARKREPSSSMHMESTSLLSHNENPTISQVVNQMRHENRALSSEWSPAKDANKKQAQNLFFTPPSKDVPTKKVNSPLNEYKSQQQSTLTPVNTEDPRPGENPSQNTGLQTPTNEKLFFTPPSKDIPMQRLNLSLNEDNLQQMSLLTPINTEDPRPSEKQLQNTGSLKSPSKTPVLTSPSEVVSAQTVNSPLHEEKPRKQSLLTVATTEEPMSGAKQPQNTGFPEVADKEPVLTPLNKEVPLQNKHQSIIFTNNPYESLSSVKPVEPARSNSSLSEIKQKVAKFTASTFQGVQNTLKSYLSPSQTEVAPETAKSSFISNRSTQSNEAGVLDEITSQLQARQYQELNAENVRDAIDIYINVSGTRRPSPMQMTNLIKKTFLLKKKSEHDNVYRLVAAEIEKIKEQD